MTELPVQRLLLAVVTVLDRMRVPYMILGGFAVRTWAIPRPTYDADLGVLADDATLQALLQELEQAGFSVPDEHKKGFHDTVGGMGKVKVTRFEEGTVWDVDLFLVRGEFLESALTRRREVSLGEDTVSVMAPEDLILLKLLAFRRKDQLDVEEILKVTSNLDHQHLLVWAERLKVRDRLEVFLRELDGPDRRQ